MMKRHTLKRTYKEINRVKDSRAYNFAGKKKRREIENEIFTVPLTRFKKSYK